MPALGAQQRCERVEAERGAEVAERVRVERDVRLLLPRSPPDDPGESRQRDAGLQKAEPGPPRYVDARQTGRNVPTIPHLNATRGRLRPAAASRPRGCRHACRPGRRCRSFDRCPPRRETARASARTRASPHPASERWKTSERPTRSKSVPGMLLNAVQKHLEGALNVVGKINAAPLFHALYDASRVRRTAFATLVTSLVALTTAAVAYAGNAGFLPGGADSPNGEDVHQALHRRRDLHRHHLRGGRGRADRLHRQVPARQARTDGRRPAGARLDAARGDLDGRPGRVPRRDRLVRLLQAARHQEPAERAGRGLDARPRSRGISSSGSSATRTARSRSTAWSRPPTRS